MGLWNLWSQPNGLEPEKLGRRSSQTMNRMEENQNKSWHQATSCSCLRLTGHPGRGLGPSLPAKPLRQAGSTWGGGVGKGQALPLFLDVHEGVQAPSALPCISQQREWENACPLCRSGFLPAVGDSSFLPGRAGIRYPACESPGPRGWAGPGPEFRRPRDFS